MNCTLRTLSFSLLVLSTRSSFFFFFFFFNDTATTEIYTLSLHDALPISMSSKDSTSGEYAVWVAPCTCTRRSRKCRDRKSTRLNSSHPSISYAVFCLKKKKKKKKKKIQKKLKKKTNYQPT